MKMRRKWLRDWKKRGESGAAAVEFAIVLPIFLAMLFGIIQFGAVTFVHNNMINAARETARRIAVGELTTNAEATNFAQGYLADWSLAFTITPVIPAVPNGDVVVTITTPAADAALIGFPIPWSGNIQAEVTMRLEG